MSNSKKTAANTASAIKYGISAGMTDAIRNIEELLAKRASIVAKVDSGMVDAKAAEEPYQGALELQGIADANLALATDEADYLQCETAANAAAEAVESMRRTMTRLNRTVQALCRMAAETDQEIEVARVDVNLEIGLLSGDFAATFADDLNEAIKPLIAVLARGQALANSTHSPSLSHFVSGVVIPNPQDASGFYPLVGDGTVMVDGQSIQISGLANIDPSAVAIAHELLSIGAIRMKLLAHRPFVHPDQRPKPYVLKGETLGFRRQENPNISAPAHEIISR